jgi:hypothetical protein
MRTDHDPDSVESEVDGIVAAIRAAGADPSIYSSDQIRLNARGHAICAAYTLNVRAQRTAEPGRRAA